MRRTVSCRGTLLSLALLSAGFAMAAEPKTREQKVREDKARVEAEGFWMYNDLPGAFEAAKKTGKPILVVLRCLPCEECVKLDDDLVDNDPAIRPLLEKFVCVRVVGTNGLDLSTFQFDTDQSFAVFMLNADGAIYGRFGTRSHQTEWIGDVSLPGMAQALQGALELHADYPNNRAALAGKRGPQPEAAAPEEYPALKGQYGSTLDYSGNVVKSCIHCHQIGDAQRELYRSRGEAIPETVLFPAPHPRSVGLTLDPKQRATVLDVEAGSPAASSGFRPGDAIRTLDGQPLVSIADLQWVLHRAAPEGAELKAVVERGGQSTTLTLALPEGWRRQGDLAWRASSWTLRRMTTGGLYLEALSDEERKSRRIPAGSMALLVKHAGEYGPHAAALNAGARKGDVLVAFDGKSNLMTESDLLAYGVTARRPGDQVPVTLLREGRRINIRIPMQE
ncbi:MAG: PDZ domain-containing protein [Planctomyces sp.]|nr:PDZ domain-containing protein [Planctomyces sp.]